MSLGEAGTFTKFIFFSVTNLLSLNYIFIPMPCVSPSQMSTLLAWLLFKMAQKGGSCPRDLAKYSVKFVSGEGKNGAKIKSGYRSSSQ